MTFTIESQIEPFEDSINSKDIILFNADTIEPYKKDHYYSYRSYQKSKVEVNEFEKLDDHKGFTITFNGDPDTHYGVIVNKNAVHVDEFVYSVSEKTFNESRVLLGSKSQEEIQDEFNSKYIKTNASYNDDQQFLDVAKYLGEILFGAVSNCPTSCVDGIFGLLSMANGYRSTEPSTIDVFNKLIDIEKKLTEISEQINENQKVLVAEDLFIETQIDTALIELYKQNYNSYITDYVEPLTTIKRDYEQYHGAEFIDIVSKATPNPIELHYEVNDGHYRLISKFESDYNKSNVRVYKVAIPSYANAKKYLEDHNGTVGNGFVDELYKDLENAVTHAKNHAQIDIDVIMTEQQYKIDCYKALLDDMEKERYEGAYGSEEYKKAQNILNATINLLNKVSGSHGVDPIIESMIQRIRCMYNFQKEARRTVRNFIANIKQTVETYTAMAVSACAYAKINQEELNNAYQAAVAKLQEYDKVNDELRDDYCFILKSNITTNFIKSIFDVSYTNPGNHCVFHKEYTWRRVDRFTTYGGPSLTKLDIDNKQVVDETSHLKINNRRKVMSQMGYDVKNDYMSYLSANSESAKQAKEMYVDMHAGKWVGTDGNRLLTSFDGLKELDGKEDLNFKCVAKGNPDGYYFSLNSYYKYKQSRSEDYWHGAKATGIFVDANGLSRQKNNIISAYAMYDEHHSYWIDDEFYAFQSNCNGDYFFVTYLG